MTVDERIALAVGRGRKLWAIVMIVAVLIVTFSMPFWYAIFLIPFAVMTYFVMLFVVFTLLRDGITSTEMALQQQHDKLKALHERADAGDVVSKEELLELLGAAGLAELTPVKALSDEIIGTIDGHPMHEWVEMMDPTTKKVERFTYYAVARFDQHGIPLLPEEEGKVYAHVDNVVYSRDIQPV